MNQVTISPNNKDTLLLVAVPKDARNIHVRNFTHGPSTLKWSNYPDKGIVPDSITCIDLEHAHYQILYLASKITEEQAKDLVKSERFNGFTYYSNYNDPGNVVLWAKYSLELLIESSGLTLGKDRDCLILKIN